MVQETAFRINRIELELFIQRASVKTYNDTLYRL